MQTQVVTWDECIQDPKSIIGSEPMATITDPLLLGFASQAQFKLQEKSRAVHRTLEFPAHRIRPEHMSIDIDDDIWRINEAYRTVKHQKCGFIIPVSLHELRREQIGDSRFNAPIPSFPISGNSNTGLPIRLAVDRRKIFFNTPPNKSELIHIDYDPYLLPFSVRRGQIPGDWQGCTPVDTGFSDFVSNNGPESEFWPLLEGIKGYVLMKLLAELGDMYVRMYSAKYKIGLNDWQSALMNASGDQPNNTINDRAAAYIGPVD